MTLNEDQTATLLNAFHVALLRFKANADVFRIERPALAQTFEDQHADTSALLDLLRNAVSIEVTDGP